MGKNLLLIDRGGRILSSEIPSYRVNTFIYDYIPKNYHLQIQVVLKYIDRIRRQPVVLDFEVLHSGRYYHRRGWVYQYHGEGILCYIEDLQTDSNIIDYTALYTSSYNEFVVARNGLILSCAYPQKTPIGDPAGVNVFDALLPEYKKKVRAVMNRVFEIRGEFELPIEYAYKIGGEQRHKVGTIKYHRGNVVFCVRRIAPPLNSP